MSIDAQLYVITAGLTLGVLVAAWQAYQLKKLYRSKSSAFGAFVFVLFGARQTYSLLRLKANISAARAQGTMIDHLNAEQWIVGVVWAYAIIVGFNVWLHWKYLDLKKLGI